MPCRNRQLARFLVGAMGQDKKKGAITQNGIGRHAVSEPSTGEVPGRGKGTEEKETEPENKTGLGGMPCRDRHLARFLVGATGQERKNRSRITKRDWETGRVGIVNWRGFWSGQGARRERNGDRNQNGIGRNAVSEPFTGKVSGLGKGP